MLKLKIYNEIFLYKLKRWNLKKKIYNKNLTKRNIYYINWFSYKQNFKNEFKNVLPRIIMINYNKYNYNFIYYMCKLNFNVKLSILDFCATIGLFLPHFCYHPDLSIAGNCRMCLVQLDGSLKPIVSCAIL